MLQTKALIVIIIAIILNGCVTVSKMYLKSPTSPKVQYCIDVIGHIEGWSPWILGGKCCCTPTGKMFDVYKKEGSIPSEMSYQQFLQLFKDKGIVTDLDYGYSGSNNRDNHGPHVVFGGKSMITPTPGTDNYEEVISGIRKEKSRK
ncbi:MAG: hypothetical protein HN921_08935 [Bacteroidetes bacterium]|jgi:hypothetical protein|nr:hypothetical protein [Bacteroidota bacterium]